MNIRRLVSELRIVAAGRGEGIEESRYRVGRNTCIGLYWFKVKDQERKGKEVSRSPAVRKPFEAVSFVIMTIFYTLKIGWLYHVPLMFKDVINCDS